MKTLFALLALISATSVTAAPSRNAHDPVTFSFYWSGNSGGQYSMTTCDVVTAQVRTLADLFGAKIEELRCSGGIQGGAGTWPLSLQVTYTPPHVDATSPTVIRSIESDRANPLCYLNTSLIRQWVKKLSFVKFKTKQDGCSTNQSDWHYDFTVQVETAALGR